MKKMLLSIMCLFVITLSSCEFVSHRFGVIFITNEADGPTDIYRISDNTQNKIEQLTFTPTVGEYNLLVSKSGDEIVFQTGSLEPDTKPSDLAIEMHDHEYLLDTASKKLKDMTDIFISQPYITSPMQVADWSPDQKRFAVITYAGDLEFIDSDGTNRRVISIPTVDKIPSVLSGAKWSPDGNKLALTSRVIGFDQQEQNPGNALLIYDIGSGEIRQLANYVENCLEPVWSPTSREIAATCILPVFQLDGPHIIRLFDTKNPGQPYERLMLSPCQNPAWSPDGRQLAFDCEKGLDQTGLFVINSDGTGIHEVTLGDLGSPSVLRYPMWSPDGSQIIYVAGTDSEHENIYSVNLDGSNNHLLTRQTDGYQIVAVYPVP